MDRAEKGELVETLRAAFESNGVIVAARYQGMTVAEMRDLRVRMKGAGGTVKVAKNRLVKLALQGTSSSGIADLFRGPTVIAMSGDPVAAPKVVAEYAKGNEKLVILGAAVGSISLDPEGVARLAATPSLGELRAKLLGLLNAPASKLARTIAEPAAGLARVIGARAKGNEAA